VELRGALHQLGGVDQVRCAALVHVDGETRKAAHERPAGARVVEVDVGEQEGPRFLLAKGPRFLLAKRLEQRVEAARGPRIDDQSVQLVGADHPISTEMHDVYLTAHPHRDHTIPVVGASEPRLPEPDRPWVMRTYAGHSTARESNELYRKNLEKGQTGLSVAFDLPTQTGYDPDHELSRGEVGKVGVSIAHKGDMHTLLDGFPL